MTEGLQPNTVVYNITLHIGKDTVDVKHYLVGKDTSKPVASFHKTGIDANLVGKTVSAIRDEVGGLLDKADYATKYLRFLADLTEKVAREDA